MTAWEDNWIYVEDRLPPKPKANDKPMLITYETPTGKRKTMTAVYTGKSWKVLHPAFRDEQTFKVIAWQKLPKPALGKIPKFLEK